MSSRNKNQSVSVAIASLVACMTGCQNTGWYGPAGPMRQQQASAAVHDPFPLTDVGPSDASQRPPGFEHSLPEAVRDRIGPDSMPWLGQ